MAFTLLASGCQGRGERMEDSPALPSVDAAVVERENISPGFKPLDSLPRVADTEPKDPASGKRAGGTSLNLSVKGAKVTIPFGALPAGIEATLTRETVRLSGFHPDDAEDPITDVYALRFSRAVRSRKVIQFGIEIPQEAASGFYGYVKIRGGRSFGEFGGDSDWSIEAGRFDPKRRILYFPISETAEDISVVVVRKGKS